MATLWSADATDAWRDALDSYADVVARQGVAALPALDRWYRDELPDAIAGRDPAHVTHDELVRLTEWKMARGVWRARNLVLVRGNDADVVERTSAAALAQAPHATEPIKALAALAGVGPATASAVMSAARPDVYPFFDELVAAQASGLGPVAFTLPYYARYAEALRERARALGDPWTPSDVERALWAHVGGKAGVASRHAPG
jgi:hypothetical protein